MDHLMREHKIPLFALESQDPVRAFDFLGITLQFELCYTNILQILDLSGIPLKASQRTCSSTRLPEPALKKPAALTFSLLQRKAKSSLRSQSQTPSFLQSQEGA